MNGNGHSPAVIDWASMPEWLTIEESSELTGYHPETLRKLAKAGRIGAEKKGRDWWIDRDKLLEFYQNRRRRGRPPKDHHNEN